MSSSSRRVCVSRCRRPTGCGGSPGSVTSTRSRRRRASSSAPSSSRRARSISASSAWRAWLAALPTGAALLGRQLGDAAQQLAAARPCGRDSARAAPRARRSSRRPRSRPRPRRAALDALDHARLDHAGAATPTSPRRARRSRPSPRSATRARSGCARRGRRPRRPPSGSPSRSAPTSSVPSPAAGAAQRLAAARATSAIRVAGQLVDDVATRASGTAKIAPMLARTAFGQYGSAQSGPSATQEAPKASARAQRPCRRCRGRRRPAGTRTAARRAAPSAARRRRARACPSRASRPPPARRARRRRRPPLPRRHGALERASPAASAAASRSSPSARKRPSRRGSRRRQAAQRLEAGVVVGCDHGAIAGTKRAPSCEERRPGGCSVSVGRRGSAADASRATSANRRNVVGVAHGDVREHLAVELDAGQLEAVHELRVAHAVDARGGVDAGDPQPAEVALAVAPVAVGVGVRLEQRLLGALVVRVRLAAEALRQLERRAALLARVDGALDAGHLRSLPAAS